MKPPRVFFSFRSPFSWLALERIARRAPGVLDVLEWIPYWEPDAITAAALAERGAVIHYAAMSKAKHLYILQDTQRLAAAMGLAIRWPVDVTPHWEVPHLGWLAARRHQPPSALPLYRAVVAARWQRGEDICDPDVMGRLAESVGVASAVVTGAAAVAAVRAEGVDALHRAWEDDIFGVPYFRHQRARFWGYDRVDAFLAALGVVTPAEVPELPAEVRERLGAYDTDSAGGCG